MDDLPAYLAILPGFFVGTILLMLVSHWARLLITALGRNPEDDSPPDKHNRRWMLLFSIVHPVPWLLVLGLPWLLYQAASEPVGAVAGWLTGGAAVPFALTITFALIAHRKFKKRGRAAERSSNHTNDT